MKSLFGVLYLACHPCKCWRVFRATAQFVAVRRRSGEPMTHEERRDWSRQLVREEFGA